MSHPESPLVSSMFQSLNKNSYNEDVKKLQRIIIIMLVISLASCIQSKPRILIIGDSISIGYTPFVKKKLEKIASVSHNPGNAQHTGTGLEKINEWIAEGDWEIIQFNWGLWDLCYRNSDSKVQGNRDKINGKITHNIDDYTSNLESIVKLIKQKSDAKLIFVTTTFVPYNEAGRHEEDAIRYNKIAKQIMVENSVLVNDIYEKSILLHDRFGKHPNDVHYLQDGYKELGMLVAEFLEQEIKNMNK